MANRPVRSNTRRTSKSSKPTMTQAEINRVKPAGILSLDLMEKESEKVTAINVKFPDGEIYQFFHLPVSIDDAEELLANTSEQNRIVGLRKLLSNLIVKEDGQQLATYDQWGPVAVKILNLLYEAITSSSREEPGED